MRTEKMNKISFYVKWAAKRIAMMLMDVLIVNASYYLALVIRFYVNNEFSMTARKYVPVFWKFAPYYTVICIAVFLCFRLYSNRWKHAGLYDLHGMLAANMLTSVFHIVGTLFFFQRMPVTYYVIGAVLQFALIVASRFACRFIALESIRLKSLNHDKKNAMIVGMGETSRILRNQIENDVTSAVRPVCIFSYRSANEREMFNGIPVVTDVNRFAEYLAKYQIKCVILADKSMPVTLRKKIRENCQERKIEVQDYSGYMAQGGTNLTPIKLLEYISGPVDIVVDGLTASFDSSEKAMLSLSGNHNVQQIYAEGGKTIVRMTAVTMVLNDVQEEWVKDTEEETGNEISFF